MAAQAQTAPSASGIARYDGLHRAAHEGDVRTIRQLASAGADVDAQDRSGRTPAHVATFASNDAALQALAEAGADAGITDHDEITPLQHAVKSGYTEIAEIIRGGNDT